MFMFLLFQKYLQAPKTITSKRYFIVEQKINVVLFFVINIKSFIQLKTLYLYILLLNMLTLKTLTIMKKVLR